MRAIIYARCSTDEKKQDVDVQLKKLSEYCNERGYNFDEKSEYDTGSKHIPQELRNIMELIGNGYYNLFIVFDLSRFSRLHPRTSTKMMDWIVEHKCRFLSLQENLDSDNEMLWHTIRYYFNYFAWLYSKNLSEKVKQGIANKKEKGLYKGGRPKGRKDKKPRSKKGYYQRKRKFNLNF